MHIGGFQKNSLIDFPGNIACVVFTSGCNFICPYCHNPDLAAGPVKGVGSLYDENEIFSFLEKRQGQLSGVAITGGEPTLQPDLVDFCQKVRKMGFKIKLDSNGTRPHILETLIDEKLIDYLAMDIKTSLAHYPLLIKGDFDVKKISESISLIMEKAPAYEFRTTCARPFITKNIMARIARMLQGADRYVLQKCSRNVPVLDPLFLKEDHHFFSNEDMQELKAIVENSVKTIALR
ncbi:MAG: anaerobic ribonucleoside-triphosphate reductase activating protein [Proteobacteria bacterium]|nr:anaerobic ribonucleoside-triphosphate reductase activating protein [Desulfobacula sp.]MBU3953191.1 anaerobic ribonucleoside-triphosphate reductase activating protein [Pseudomonadota bacterium]MBU4133441.1 anaerobic ribonucleoside-triphosphate reductase activating protein [Pseudomonadota bacterium]